jgi:hypothetical protein
MDPPLATKFCEIKENSFITTMESSSDSHMMINSLEIGSNVGIGDLESPALRSEIRGCATLSEES